MVIFKDISKKTARVTQIARVDFFRPESPRPQVEFFQAGEHQRVKSLGQGSDTRAALFLSCTTKPRNISSFITKNKDLYDMYDKILQNTCLGQNLMRFALCEQCPPKFRDVTKQ
jgi:hypothetical protein